MEDDDSKFLVLESEDEEELPNEHIWNTQIATWRMTITQDYRFHTIIGFDGTSIRFNYLGEVIHLLQMSDLSSLYGMVTARLEGAQPEGIGLQLLGDLTVLFDSSTSEGKGYEAWQGQYQWRVYSWVFYPVPAVYKLTSIRGNVIYMFSDVEYPFSLGIMEQMLKQKFRVPRDMVGNDRTLALQLVASIKKRVADIKKV